MKIVRIELSNIQSHQSTVFVLKPGLNFILADDNNVGKSTIFKILTFIVKMPDISNEDSREILRVGESQGYASFHFDDSHVILWLFRDTGDRIRVFFENKSIDGTSTRSVECPSKLLEALDIIRGNDGTPINFNDADSVQLVVQDTSKNDEVLSHVLIDLKVEDVKKNLQQLSRQIVQDYKHVTSKLEDTKHLLANLTYNDSVELFHSEQEILFTACQVMDSIESQCSLTSLGDLKSYPEGEDLNRMQCARDLLVVLSSLNFEHLLSKAVLTFQNLDQLEVTSNVLDLLRRIDLKTLGCKVPAPKQKLDNMRTCIDVLNKCLAVYYSAESVVSASSKLISIQQEIDSINQILERDFQVVECPVKGKVFYSDKECIPSFDGFTS